MRLGYLVWHLVGGWHYQTLLFVVSCRLEALKDPGKECSSGSRPSVSVLQLRLLCCFAAGALMASWTWTPAAAAAWRLYLAR